MLEGFAQVSGFGQCWHPSHLADKMNKAAETIHEVEIKFPKLKCFDLRQLHSKNQTPHIAETVGIRFFSQMIFTNNHKFASILIF